MLPFSVVHVQFVSITLQSSLTKLSDNKCSAPYCKHSHSSGGWEGLGIYRSFAMSHGKGDVILSDKAPHIAWASYSSGALLESIQQIAAVLKDREDKASSSWDVASDSSAGGVQQPELTAQGLKKPWTCGFCCRWCEEPCLRKEGHTFHSCYNHRHRR